MRTLPMIAMLLVATTAQAQVGGWRTDRITRAELTLFGGWRDGGQLTGVDFIGGVVHSGIQIGVDVDGSPSYGFAIAVPVGADYQLELWTSRQGTTMYGRRELSTGSRELSDIDITYLHLGVVRSWFREHGRYYLGLAAGVTELNPSYPGVGPDNRFSASLATGGEYTLTEHFGLRLDVRGYWTAGNDALSRWSAPLKVRYPSNLLQTEVSAGVTARW